MGPVFASIDVKVCQEFHSLLVKIHDQGLWLPSTRTPQGSVTSLASHAPTPPPPLVAGTPKGGALSSPEGPGAVGSPEGPLP